jgi:hypothetical protein
MYASYVLLVTWYALQITKRDEREFFVFEKSSWKVATLNRKVKIIKLAQK